MASAPVYAVTPNVGMAAVSVANANRDGTGTIVDCITAPAAGCRVERIVAKATGDPADSIVTIFVDDGTGYELFDEIDLGNPAAASATVTGYRATQSYSDFYLKSGWKLGFAITATPTSGVVNCWATAVDLT